jgi:Fic family protein
MDQETVALTADAHHSLGRLDGLASTILAPDLFLYAFVRKEALLSSQIEGTQCSLEDVLSEDPPAPETVKDVEEVSNYVAAMKLGLDRLGELPISSRLIREMHARLMAGVRGSNKTPGEYRTTQNWIGRPTANLQTADFIPPPPHEVPECMSQLEKFIHNDDSLPNIIKAGLIHAQFETIHPFLDGNGRLGRLLITLYLMSNQLLTKPSLYLSDFINRNKELYYDNLTRVRLKNDLNQWLRFFLVGVSETADDATQTFRAVLALKYNIESTRINQMGKRATLGIRFLETLFRNPVVSTQQVVQTLSIAHATANRLIDQFVEKRILTEKTGFRRNRLFEFSEYILLFDKRRNI